MNGDSRSRGTGIYESAGNDLGKIFDILMCRHYYLKHGSESNGKGEAEVLADAVNESVFFLHARQIPTNDGR